MRVSVVEEMVLSVVVVVQLTVALGAEVEVSMLARAVVPVPVLRSLTKSCWSRAMMKVMTMQS